MIAYQTSVMAHKIIKSRKPTYIAQKLVYLNGEQQLRNQEVVHPPAYRLGISKEGFIYRAAAIMNKMGEKLVKEEDTDMFKTAAKEWVKKHVKIKPTPNPIFRGRLKVHRNQEDTARANPNLITRYFQPAQQNQIQEVREATRQTLIDEFFVRS